MDSDAEQNYSLTSVGVGAEPKSVQELTAHVSISTGRARQRACIVKAALLFPDSRCTAERAGQVPSDVQSSGPSNGRDGHTCRRSGENHRGRYDAGRHGVDILIAAHFVLIQQTCVSNSEYNGSAGNDYSN